MLHLKFNSMDSSRPKPLISLRKLRVTVRAFIKKKDRKSKPPPTEGFPGALTKPLGSLAPISSAKDADEIHVLSSIGDAFHHPSLLDIRRAAKHSLTGSDAQSSRQRFQTLVASASARSQTCRSVSTGAGLPRSANGSMETLVVGARSMKLDDLKFKKLLGVGTSGQVYLVKDKVSRGAFALKVVRKEGRNENACRSLLKEQTTLRLLENSVWCLSLDASWSDTNNFYLAMPYFPTDLDSELMRCGVFEPARAQFYMAELIIAIKDLHSRGVIHRDIKAPNILIDREGHIVLADFGLSRNFGRTPTLPERMAQPYWPYLPDDVITYSTPYRDPKDLIFVSDTPCGSPLESAPEVWMGAPYSFGVDFWSATVTLYWMLTGRPPWYADDDMDIRRQIVNDDVTFLQTDDVDGMTKDFICQMLEKQPQDRLRIGLDMEEHPYFAGINWVLMEKRAVPTPWVPGAGAGHVMPGQTFKKFVPGKAYNRDVEDPYPEFKFTSEKIKAGAIVKNFPEEDEDEEEGSDDNGDGDDNADPHANEENKDGDEDFAAGAKPSKIKHLLLKLFSRSEDHRKVPDAFSRSARCLTPSSSRSEIPSHVMEIIILNPPTFSRPESPVFHPVQNGTGLLFKIKVWTRNIWVPKAREVTGSSRRFNLLE